MIDINKILQQAGKVKSLTKKGNANFVLLGEYNNWETWGRLHDAILEVSKINLSIINCVCLFHRLPERIQTIAFQYGFNDTVFGDEVCEFIKDNKQILNDFRSQC